MENKKNFCGCLPNFLESFYCDCENEGKEINLKIKSKDSENCCNCFATAAKDKVAETKQRGDNLPK